MSRGLSQGIQDTADTVGGYIQSANSVYGIARKSKKQAKSWKNQLSGAFNEEQIFLSLVVIGLFYFAYTMTNFFIGNGKDEDFITRNCHCEFTHRFFYRLWFYICLVIWFIIYSFTFMEQVSKHVCPNTCGKCLQNFRDWIRRCVMGILCCPYKCIWKRVWKWIKDWCTCCCCCCSKSNNLPNNDNGDAGKDSVIEAKIKQLWFYYYKLYIIGYKKDDYDWTIVLPKQENSEGVTSPSEAPTTYTHEKQHAQTNGGHIHGSELITGTQIDTPYQAIKSESSDYAPNPTGEATTYPMKQQAYIQDGEVATVTSQLATKLESSGYTPYLTSEASTTDPMKQGNYIQDGEVAIVTLLLATKSESIDYAPYPTSKASTTDPMKQHPPTNGNRNHGGELGKVTPQHATKSESSDCGCQCTCYYIINIFFTGVKYVAQLATVPLILVQMFDTYSLLCFVPNEEYCTSTSEYRIHAVQTILTVSFYCSLALSLLANTILDWNPWPNKHSTKFNIIGYA